MGNLRGKTLGVYHAANLTIPTLTQYAQKYLPGVSLMHFCDDTIQRDNLAAPVGEIPKRNYFKFAQYCHNLEESGVDAILLCCSTFNYAAELASEMINVPIIQIDRAMMDKAVATGRKIGLLCTLPSTVPSSERLLKKAAEDAGKKIEIKTVLCNQAFIELTEHNDVKKHNELLLKAIDDFSDEVDCVVMAQLSMSALAPFLQNTKIPVYTSGDTGVLLVKEILENI